LSQYLVVVAAVALLVLIIYRQMSTQLIQPRQLIVPPAILGIFGLYTIQGHPPNSAAAGVALGASVITALAFGVARGLTTRIWSDHGVAMRKGTTATLALWIAAIAVRIAIGLVARHTGVPYNLTVSEIPLFLGFTLAAQNVVIWLRGSTITMSDPRLINN
jgi:hypothetical protein